MKRTGTCTPQQKTAEQKTVVLNLPLPQGLRLQTPLTGCLFFAFRRALGTGSAVHLIAPLGCSVMRTVAAVLALVACVHAGLWALLRTSVTAPDVPGQLASVSYAPFVNSKHPDYGERPTAEQIRADLKAIAPYTRAIRTYSSTGGAELIPPIAAEFGLKVAVGALDRQKSGAQ